ncbi:MAG: hypothetical protein JKY01_11770 [Pseudomonadales bacterium]|nr:hypothetical protein [Pseudomonadales bacterium]
MKASLKVLSASVALATIAAAGSVSAAPLTLASPVDLEIKISGASASDKALKGVFETLCDGDSLAIFTDRCSDDSAAVNGQDCGTSSAKLPGKSYAAYFCTMGAAAGIPTQNVLVRKRSTGGSFWGTVPVASADNTVDQMQLGANCGLDAPGVYKCDKGVTEATVSDAGISDEEPGLFTSINVAAGKSPMTTTLAGQLDVQPIAALTFGIPVTNALYGALQKAQGLNEDLDGDLILEGTSETATEADILANMPTLTKEHVAALMKGSIPEWSSVQYGGVPLTATAGIAAPADARVTICRRVNGSGTQAQLNANFLNAPCAADAEKPAVDNTTCTDTKGNANSALPFCGAGYAVTTATTAGVALVHENSGSGDVTECLDQLQAANRWAVGVQSMEKASSEWSFVKINGEAPTLENVNKGKYFDWAATTIQWRNAAVNGVPAPSGDMLAVLNAIRTEAGKPSVLDALNDKTNQNIGATGYLALNGAGVASPFNTNLPVMQYVRDGKTCNVQKAVGIVDFD